MNIKTYLNQSYPFYYEDLKKVGLLLCVLALASFLFTYLFEPFTVTVAEHKISTLGIQLVHAFLPIPISLIYVVLLGKGVTDTNKWTLGKEFFHLAMILLLIGLSNFLIRDFIYTNPDNWSFRYFWEEIRNTFLVGTLLLTIILPLNLERLLYKHLSVLKKLPSPKSEEQKSELIHIETPIPTEKFDLNLKHFLFSKVEGNYLEVFVSSSGGFDKYLKRMTLKELETQLSAFPCVLKVHRSYVVNLNAITSISGNAQGYELELNNYSSGVIPVSRSKIQTFNRCYSECNS